MLADRALAPAWASPALSRSPASRHGMVLPAVGVLIGAALVALIVGSARALPSAGPAQVAAPVVLLLVCGFFASVRRYGLVLSGLMLYLGLLDGWVKLRTDIPEVTLVRDLLFYSVVAGALLRMAVHRDRFTWPRWTAAVVAFVAIVLVQLGNPLAPPLGVALQGLRPHLEWVPLFFFGFALLRERKHLYAFLMMLLLIAAINGVAGFVQSQLTPEQLAAWGPGYAERIEGTDAYADASRVYWDASGPHVRPLALGSDSGFGGLVGVLALPAGLALMAMGRRWTHRLFAVVCTAGAIVGVVTSQQRTSVVAAFLAVCAFTVLASVSGRAVRTILGLAVTLVIVVGVVDQVRDRSQHDPFTRYSTIAPDELLAQTGANRGGSLTLIPVLIEKAPAGVGLGRSGPAAGLVDSSDIPLRTGGARPDSETQFTYMLSELGVAGLVAILGLQIAVVVAAVRTVRRISDPETRLLLAATGAPLVPILLAGVTTSTTATTPFAPYFWLVAGALAFWSVRLRPARGTG